MKVKVMIVDGTIDAVLGDDETMQSSLQVEIIDFDRDRDSKEAFLTHYESELQDIPFTVTHPL